MNSSCRPGSSKYIYMTHICIKIISGDCTALYASPRFFFSSSCFCFSSLFQ